ncbi:hypothetical protein SPF06_02625 [Sinomonas sp. JGH33]|uniref:Uncharacterized protein n=1 Tax=Sinomonas terricola TaxID=3110330 RepID=A0ABU5T1R7_9MICC|nr:hypothetical protein [Sinomonas sp. JGH33]MEA5453607.1 hypothetical protein [Sinomonas sp. JGH33]
MDLVRSASRSASAAGLEPSVRALGRARAEQGVGAAEAVMDLFAFFGALGMAAPAQLVAAFAETWAEFADGCCPGISCVDPATGLSTWAHFRARIYELYSEDDAAGDGAATDARLVAVLRLPEGTASVASLPWEVQVTLGREVLDAFAGSAAVLSHTGATIASLMPRAKGAFARLHDAAARLDRLFRVEKGRGCRLDVEPLPRTANGVALLLESLRR